MGTGGVDQQQMYDAALKEHGRKPEDFSIAQLRTVFVASKHDKAWDDAEAGAHYMMSCYGKWFVEANDLPGDQAFGSNLPPIGKLRALGDRFAVWRIDADRHAGRGDRRIEDYSRRTRVTHLVAAMDLPGMDPRKVRREYGAVRQRGDASLSPQVAQARKKGKKK